MKGGSSLTASADEMIFSLDLQAPLEGVLALHRSLGILVKITCAANHPQLLAVQLFTPTELTLLLPLLESYPDYCPYEVCYARFHGATSDREVTRAREMLYTTMGTEEWEIIMRPMRNVLSRIRLKLRTLDLEVRTLLETGYLLAPRKQKREPEGTRDGGKQQ